MAQYVKQLIGNGTDLQEHHPIVPIPVNEQKTWFRRRTVGPVFRADYSLFPGPIAASLAKQQIFLFRYLQIRNDAPNVEGTAILDSSLMTGRLLSNVKGTFG